MALEDAFPFLSAQVPLIWQTRLCVPADKNGETPGTENHAALLMCYRTARGRLGLGNVHINNQFGPGVTYPRFRNELCLPSTLTP